MLLPAIISLLNPNRATQNVGHQNIGSQASGDREYTIKNHARLVCVVGHVLKPIVLLQAPAQSGQTSLCPVLIFARSVGPIGFGYPALQSLRDPEALLGLYVEILIREGYEVVILGNSSGFGRIL